MLRPDEWSTVLHTAESDSISTSKSGSLRLNVSSWLLSFMRLRKASPSNQQPVLSSAAVEDLEAR